jgi:hypothetical protein
METNNNSNTASGQSALSTIRDLFEACGPQTMEQILRELMDQTVGCDNIHDAKKLTAYALGGLRQSGNLAEEEIDGETFYDLAED